MTSQAVLSPPATMPRDEQFMRDLPDKRRDFIELAENAWLRPVAAALRAYLRAVVADPAAGERDHWSMSCLPDWSAARLSAISMADLQVCALHVPRDPDAGALGMVVVVRRSALTGSDADLAAHYPGLDFSPSGPDRITAAGYHDDLVEALSDPAFAVAAQHLAAHLLTEPAIHWADHNYQLADYVLRRS